MPKPPFNPNQPVDSDKPKFDPSQPVESTPLLGASLKDSKLGQLLGAVLSPMQAGREGFVKGATFGGLNSLFPGAEKQTEQSPLNKAASLAGETGASLGQGELVGAGLGKAASGITRGGAKLMDMALGTKAKDLPGIGKVAYEEGLVGTKGMMAKQAQKKATEKANQITKLVGELGNTTPEQTTKLLSHDPTAEALRSVQDQFLTSTGQPVSGAMEANPVIESWASKVGERAPSTPQEMLEFKRATNKLGYSGRTGDPLQSLKAKLAQKESESYGQQLSDAWRAAHPENPEALSDLNYKTSRLLKAQKAAERGSPRDLSSILMKAAARTPGAVLGSSVGGPLGAGIGAAIPEELLASGAAQLVAKPAAATLKALQPASTLAPLGAQVQRMNNSQPKPPFDPNQPIE